jgi:hypothetical protein
VQQQLQLKSAAVSADKVLFSPVYAQTAHHEMPLQPLHDLHLYALQAAALAYHAQRDVRLRDVRVCMMQ